VTGSINGSDLKWLTQEVFVEVAGKRATVAFAGAAPTLLDGVQQLNLQLALDTPAGPAQPIVITVGSASSPASATLAVQ
jgi:uncharacterized protein (TIGR03437 family)